MTQKELYEIFKKIQEHMKADEFKEKTIEKIKEYINTNFTDIEAIALGNKNIYIIPKEDMPIKITYK